MEGAYEIGEIAEPDVQCDVGNRPAAVGEHSRRPAQTGADQVLVRGDAEDFCEGPQEVKGADPYQARRAFEIDRIAGMSVDPERGFHRAAAIARRGLRPFSLAPGDDVDEARREDQPHFVEVEVGSALGHRLRQLTDHHQLGQGWNAAAPPELSLAADRVDQRRGELKRQTFVAVDVVVGAGVLVPALADEDRPCHQLKRFTSAVIAEAAFAHVGDGEGAVLLDAWLVRRPDVAQIVDHRDRALPQKSGSRHLH